MTEIIQRGELLLITHDGKEIEYNPHRANTDKRYKSTLAKELGVETKDVVRAAVKFGRPEGGQWGGFHDFAVNSGYATSQLTNNIRNPMLQSLDSIAEHAKANFKKDGKERTLYSYSLNTISSWLLTDVGPLVVATVSEPGERPMLYIASSRGIMKKENYHVGNIRPLECHADNCLSETVPLYLKAASADHMKLFPNLAPYLITEEEDPAKEWLSLFRDLKEFIKDHTVLVKEVYYDITAAFTLATWIRELFNAVPYLSASGRVGTGKSILAKCIEKLGFLGAFMVDISTASLAEIDERYHPVYVLDEAQRLTDVKDEKTSEILAILNVRYSRGGKRVKMSDAVEGKARELSVKNVFGFCVVVGTRLPASDALQSRTIKLPSIEGKPKAIIDTLDSDVRASILRGRMLAFRLRMLSNPIQREFKELSNVRGRTHDKAFPILYSIPPDYENGHIVDEFKSTDKEEGDEFQLTEPAEVIAAYCRALDDLLKRGSETLALNISEVLTGVNGQRDEKERMSGQKIGLVFRGMGFKRKKVRGITRVPFNIQLLRAQIQTYNVDLKEYESLYNYLEKRSNQNLEAPSVLSTHTTHSTLSKRERIIKAAKEIDEESDRESATYNIWGAAGLETEDEAREAVVYLLRAGIWEEDSEGVIRRGK